MITMRCLQDAIASPPESLDTQITAVCKALLQKSDACKAKVFLRDAKRVWPTVEGPDAELSCHLASRLSSRVDLCAHHFSSAQIYLGTSGVLPLAI